LIHPHDAALAILQGTLQSPLIRLGSPNTDSGRKQLAHESEAKGEVATAGDPAAAATSSATAETFDILQEDQFDALRAAEELTVATTTNAHARTKLRSRGVFERFSRSFNEFEIK